MHHGPTIVFGDHESQARVAFAAEGDRVEEPPVSLLLNSEAPQVGR